MNHEIDGSVVRRASRPDHRALAQFTPSLDSLVDPMANFDNIAVVRTMVVVPWHDSIFVNESIIAQAFAKRRADPIGVVVVGGGAAGLAAAIFAARSVTEAGGRVPANLRILVLDGARSLGAKILVSGGSRCNVTNTRVEAADFWRSGSAFVRQVLRALPVPETIAFFEELGVPLKEEPSGKLFPVTNKARSVLDALLGESRRLGIEIRMSCRVLGLAREGGGFRVETSTGPLLAERVVLATGGESLPRTGSDGFGYALARNLGHTIVPTVPALEPLILGGDFHWPLSGIAHEAELRIARRGEKVRQLQGSVLWTHFGVSGPLALNASRFVRRAWQEESPAAVSLSFTPGLTPTNVNQRLIEASRAHPHQKAGAALVRDFGLVQAVAARLVNTSLGSDQPISRLTREGRLALVEAITALPLNITGGRGYNFAEVTSGGVAIEEVNPKTMESRLAPGLHFVGEILDVDGRIGGFNFQWAWSTGKVAGRALARPAVGASSL